MGTADGTKVPSGRLTNLTQTDLLPHLPLPSIQITGVPGAEQSRHRVIDDATVARDTVLLSQLNRLLQLADVSNL